MPGPAPLPDNVRALRGNPGKRKTPARVKAVAAIPDPPEWLEGEARAEWDRVTPELHRLGILATLDRAVLTLYCDAWGRWVEAAREMESLTTVDERKLPRKHPLLQVYRDLGNSCSSLADKLGLTPNTRLRMKAPEADEDDSSILD